LNILRSTKRSTGIRYDWLYDGAVLKCTLLDVRRETLDDINETVSQVILDWDIERPGLPYRVAYDMTAPDVHMTPYLRCRAENLAQTATDSRIQGGYAIVVSEGIKGHALGFYFRRVLSQHTPHLDNAMFHSMENALAWLLDIV
jgi:hypothetical protein